MLAGKALSFLFGTVSEDDLGTIRHNVKRIAKNQQTLNHVVKQSLTILKTTQAQSIENTKTIDSIIETLSELRDFYSHLQSNFIDLRDHVQTYIELDMSLSEAKGFVDLARDQLQHLESQLSVLSQGRISTAVISPIKFKSLLLEIQNKLDPEVRFPFDPEKELWDFYKALTCTTVIEENKLVVIIAIPLLDTMGDYELFRVHNFPIPRSSPNHTDLLATFSLEANALAIDRKRTQYALLTDNEVRACAIQLQGFCAFRSPVYSIMGTTMCLMHIFLESTPDINKYCTTMVQYHTASPRAQYLLNGHWIVISSSSLTFKVICKDTETSKIIKTNHPLDVISLEKGCSAFSGPITLLPYFYQESKYNMTSNLRDFMFRFKSNSLKLWRTFEIAFPNSSKIKIPKKMKINKKVPIDVLINELKNVSPVEIASDGMPEWIYVILALAILTILAIVYKFRHQIQKYISKFKINKQSVKKGNTEVGQPTYGLVATNANGDVHDDQDVQSRIYRPNKKLAKQYMAEKYDTTFGLGNLSSWRNQLKTGDDYESGTHPFGGFYFRNMHNKNKSKTVTPEQSGNDSSIRTDTETDEPQQMTGTTKCKMEDEQSMPFSESTRIYPNLRDLCLEGRKRMNNPLKK